MKRILIFAVALVATLTAGAQPAAVIFGIVGSTYLGFRIEQNAYERYIWGWQPLNRGTYLNNYYDFFYNF